MHTVDELMQRYFNKPRDPRSPEYKAGARAILALRIEKKPPACPYDPGTAQSDAWHAGTQEGHHIWRDANT